MLVVIDCQKRYPAVELVIDAVIKEIQKAKGRSEWVMLLTYGGRTVSRIAKHLRGYHKTVKVQKDHDDGSPAIFERLYGYHWRNSKRLGDKHIGDIRRFRVVGVNTSACVMKTVDGLRRIALVTVVRGACANAVHLPGITPGMHHNAALRRMGKWQNVRIA